MTGPDRTEPVQKFQSGDDQLPLVSIGMPTHNGDRYIRLAIEDLLAQDYPNIELCVRDNASRDDTARLVREFAANDGRVRYLRVDEAIGAAENFNEVYRSTTGQYFMWAADDDRWEPTYVRRCVEALETHPDAVVATSELRFIDESGVVIDADYEMYDNPDLSSSSARARLRTIARRGGWYMVYGLMRRSALDRTHLARNVYGADVALVIELAMLGPFARVSDVLFWYRQVGGRTQDDRARRQGAIPDSERVLATKYTHLEETLSSVIDGSAAPRAQRLALKLEVFRAAYLDITPMSQQTRTEIRTRIRFAREDGDARGALKYTAIYLVQLVANGWRNVRRTADRAVQRSRKPWL